MRTDKKNLISAVSAVSLLLGFIIAPAALAGAVADDAHDLKVEVDLASGLSLSCTKLNFGTVVLEVSDDRGGSNTVIITPSLVSSTDPRLFDAPTISFTGEGRATHDASAANPALCTVSGISDITNAIKVRASTLFTNLEFEGSGSGFGAANLAVTINGVTTSLRELITSARADDGLDITRFLIGGELLIANSAFSPDHAGTYSSAAIEIEVEEEIQT